MARADVRVGQGIAKGQRWTRPVNRPPDAGVPMTAQGPLRLHHLSTQLAELLMTAALCAQELQHAIEAELGRDGNGRTCDPAAAGPPGPAG